VEHASGGREPVIVLTYSYADVARLERLLAGSAALACTSGTGLLPLCAEAVGTWSRWCETSFAPPAAAEAFLQLYPDARFLCWHRDGQNVIRAGVQANPWGLADRGLAPYVAAYPGSSLAAMAAFWADRSEALLRFEEAHPGNCHRVRHEDLARHPGSVAVEISAFVGADAALPTAMATPAELSGGGLPGVTDGEAGTGRDGNGKAGGPGGLGLPAGLMPRGLADRVNDLQARFGYAPLQLV
jgi:Sulfotransferase family